MGFNAMDEKKYNPNQDYCEFAKNAQSVPSFDQYRQANPDIPIDKVDTKRAETPYSCADNYRMGSIQDNYIYISTTPTQHDQLVEHKHVDGLSGYFSDQATIDACKTDGVLDNAKYNEMCQISPYREGGLSGEGDATYKPHIDCFELDRNALYANYGTYDFNAAIGKCEANNHLGSGGGNQGVNPHISEMIDNHTLNHTIAKSYSDPTINTSKHTNPNMMSNSVVPEADYRDIMRDVKTRAQDSVTNNTPNPSPEACNNGFQKNSNPIASNTGHATEWNPHSSNDPIHGEAPPPPTDAPANENQIRGTAPDQAQGIDLPNSKADASIGKDLAEDATKKNNSGFDANAGIT